MIAYLIGTAGPWIGLIVWMWIAEYQSESWIGSAWSLPRLEYFDVPWILVLVLLVPIATAWACGEVLRLMRRPRLFDRRAGGSTWRRLAIGLMVGLISVALVGVATAYQSETHLPDVANVMLSVMLPTVGLGLLLPRLRPGHCVVCNYDTRHLPFPETPGPRRCPECGCEVA